MCMKITSCPLCGSAERERDLHLQRMDEFHQIFSRRHRYALQEYNRLEIMLRDVVWYNFETVARTWRHPWPESFPQTTLTLHGMRFQLTNGRGGRKAEKADFPIYYCGAVQDAPPLPPQIILHELEDAYRLVKETEAACAAPYEWAPGGRMYEQMVRESPGVAAFSSKCSVKTRDGGTRSLEPVGCA